MKKRISKVAVACLAMGGAVAARAEGFDPVTVITDATATVGGIATAIGGLLAGAAVIYAGFLGYRKYRESMNKA